MRPLSPAGSDPRFLLKALGEAAGEARRALSGIPRRYLLRKGAGRDDDWCLLAIAVHLRDVEFGFTDQIEAFFLQDDPRLPHVDVDAIPLAEEYEDEDEDEVLDDLQRLRRRNTYLLWDLTPSDWRRQGERPYQGTTTLLDLAREMYQHDLEHLWQARRLIESLASRTRR